MLGIWVMEKDRAGKGVFQKGNYKFKIGWSGKASWRGGS